MLLSGNFQMLNDKAKIQYLPSFS